MQTLWRYVWALISCYGDPMTPHAFPPNIAKSRTTPSPPESLLHIPIVQLVWVTNVTKVTGNKIKKKKHLHSEQKPDPGNEQQLRKICK